MTLVSPSQSNPNDTIEAADINNPINQLAAVINGGIDTNNITDGGIATADLADGSVTSAKVPTGTPVQMVATNYSAVATGTTVIPNDDTIPQNTEGDQFMSQGITPKSATNRLFIEAELSLAISSNGQRIAALFQDTTANALAAKSTYVGNFADPVILRLTHDMVAGTTSATTFKVRAGSEAAGTWTFNGSAGARKFGGVTLSTIKITEYKA